MTYCNICDAYVGDGSAPVCTDCLIDVSDDILDHSGHPDDPLPLDMAVQQMAEGHILAEHYLHTAYACLEV